MKERLAFKGLQGEYIISRFSGDNSSGIHPLGKRVLVMMDEAPNKTAGGVHMAPDIVERMSLASESGVVVELGAEAFTSHHDGTPWSGVRPVPGTRVYVEKYAGLLAQGGDGRKYRIMDDGCIGGTFDTEGGA